LRVEERAMPSSLGGASTAPIRPSGTACAERRYGRSSARDRHRFVDVDAMTGRAVPRGLPS
jgi:hypothetical protein